MSNGSGNRRPDDLRDVPGGACVEPAAVFSLDRLYRYTLVRSWRDDLSRVAFVGLNPSTADETADDPTIRKCVGFAKRWGFGSLVMLNLFAWRSTDPKGLRGLADPIGPENDARIECETRTPRVTRVVAAWGANKAARGRDLAVIELLTRWTDLHVLRLTKNRGDPEHPLYMPYETPPRVWRGRIGR